MIELLRAYGWRRSARQAGQAKRWNEAAALYERLRDGPAFRPSDAVRLAAAYEAQGKTLEARAALEAAVVAFAAEANVHRQKALFDLRMGDTASARVDFAKARMLADDVKVLDADLERLDVALETARVEALAAFAAGPEPRPAARPRWDRFRAGRLARRAKALRAKGDWAEAVAVQTALLTYNPSNSAAHIRMGHALKESGRLAQAEASYWRGVALAPGSADAFVQLGHVLKVLHGPDAALPAYLVAARLAPEDPGATRDLGDYGLAADDAEALGLALRNGDAKAFLDWRRDPSGDGGDAASATLAEAHDEVDARFAKFDIPWPRSPDRPLPKSRFVDVRAAAIAGDLGLHLGVRL